MSKNVIREDKTCLNCSHQVAERFCPNCGQENIESRKTFHQLFIHFFEDLTHYENAFWRTIKNLLLKPSSLTKEYLSGKRLSYLAPVRLYIFISFITFFLMAVLPDTEYNLIKVKTTKTTNTSSKDTVKVAVDPEVKEGFNAAEFSTALKDSIRKAIKEEKESEHTKDSSINKVTDDFKGTFINGINSVKQLDSIQKYAPEDKKYGAFSYSIMRKALEVLHRYKRKELAEKFKESFTHNFPKTLFIYMPIFALFLWLFHDKKRWYYFDHGIFTLHYFSFLLLVALIVFLYSKLLSLFGESGITEAIKGVLDFVAFAWMVYYFFPAHHRFYGESRWVSFIKSMFLFFINIFLIVIILSLFAIYTFINLH